MSKRTILILIALLVVFLLVGLYIIAGKTGPQAPGEELTGVRGFVNNFFPFGNTGTNERPVNIDDRVNLGDPTLISAISADGILLQQLTKKPVAGSIATTTEQGALVARYIERSTGNIFDVDLSNLKDERVTNTTVPEIYDAVWHKDAERFVMRYLNENDVVKSFLGTVVPQSTSTNIESIGQLDGIFLEDDVREVTTNPTNTMFLYTLPRNLGSTAIVSGFQTEDRDIVFDSDFGEWTLQWRDENTLTATPKPSFIANGFMYEVDIESGSFRKIFGGQKGLETLSNASGTKVLYSEYIDSKPLFHVFDVQSRGTSEYNFNTLPTKCTWNQIRPEIAYCGAPINVIPTEYPDMWYQGVISFSDSIWEINTDTNTAREIASPIALTGESIDAIKLSVDPTGNYLLFVNKKDSTLWSLELEQPVIVPEVVPESELLPDTATGTESQSEESEDQS